MTNKVDKSIEEVWEMREATHERFLKSGFSNYAEYLKFRQTEIDEYFKNNIKPKNKIAVISYP